MVQVQSLVRESRSCILSGGAEKKKKNPPEKQIWVEGGDEQSISMWHIVHFSSFLKNSLY